MELQEVKQLIGEAKNICVIPSQTNEPESLTAALALFYILKELHKNVNLIIQDFPEKLNFLVPSLDFITSPKNFVISIPKSVAEVSQIYYEKNEENLKIHLTVDKGRVRKEDVLFYFSEAKPDLIITLGIKDLQSQLSDQLDSFGFILDTPIINIDNEELSDTIQNKNKKFGNVNLVEEKSISEILFTIAKSINENTITKNVADCILAGLIIHYENLHSAKINPELLETFAALIRKGAIYQEVINNVNKITEKEVYFLGEIFKNLKTENHGVLVAKLDSDELQNFAQAEATFAVEKIKTIGIQSDLLVLWKSHASPPMVKGFFYSRKQDVVDKIIRNQPFDSLKASPIKNNGVFLSINEMDINVATDKAVGFIQ